MTAILGQGVRARLGAFRLGPVSLEAGAGEAVAILGPSGSGKTTLLRAVGGFLPLEAGRIQIDGIDCTNMPPERRGLGYVPQGYGLLPHRNVLQNVRYPAELKGSPDADGLATTMLRRFDLEPLARAYPAQLSGGEQQRVAMARALAARPRLLLWDEPLAALDALAQDALLDLLREVLEAERVPLLLVTHDPGTAFSIATRCIVLERGRSVFSGPMESLLHHPPNPFAARFLGMENVYRTADLASAGGSEFARWLVAHGGREGVCVPADQVEWSWQSGRGWRGSLRRVKRTPRGLELWVDLQGVVVRVVRPERHGDGDGASKDREIWICVDADALVPIEGVKSDDGSVRSPP